MKTIARITEITNSYTNLQQIELIFQHVDIFNVIKKDNIEFATESEKKGFSDWIGSGDLCSCIFNHENKSFIKLFLDNNFRSLSFSLMSKDYSSYELESIKKEISQFQRIEKLIDKDLDYIDKAINTVDIEILLSILFKRLGVIGGLIKTNKIKQVFNVFNRINTISDIAKIINNTYKEDLRR